MLKLDFKSYINETPLGMFNTHEIPPEDRNNKVTSPLFKTDVEGKLKQILDKTRWNFNINFVYDDLRNAPRKFPNVDNSINILIPQAFYRDAANGVRTIKGFFGLSPWMILHRIGHLVSSKSELGLMAHRLIFNKRNISTYPENILLLYKFFVFKSANNKNPLDIPEFANELVAEYLWHGGNIRLKNNPPKELIDAIEEIKTEIAKTLDSMVGRVTYC